MTEIHLPTPALGRGYRVRNPKPSGTVRYTNVDVTEEDSVLILPPSNPQVEWRDVAPGEDVATLAASNQNLKLLAGTHAGFQIDTDDVRVLWDAGAVVREGAWNNANNVQLLDVEVSGAVRAVAIFGKNAFVRVRDISGSANGILVRGEASGEITGGRIHDITRMVRNTQSPTNDDFGAMAVDFHDTVGPIWLHHMQFDMNRVMGPVPTTSWNHSGITVPTAVGPAGLSWDYLPTNHTEEGSIFEVWQAKGITIEDVVGFNSQIVVETGRSATNNGPDCSFTMRRFAFWNAKTDTARKSKGLLLRSATDTLIEHGVLDGMDDWAISIQAGGNFGGSVSGLEIRDTIAISPSAFIRGGTGITGWTQHHNLVGGTKVWGDVTPGSTGISADPMFVDAPNHDYHLQPGSPAIGAGHDGSNIGRY